MDGLMARVLIADDEQGMVDSLAEFLRFNGHEVSCAATGTQALALCQAQPFNVVVVDVIMPGMDGITLMSEIKRRCPDLHVILMTGEPSLTTAAQAVRGGAFDYLAKPIRLGDLHKVVTAAALDVERRRAECVCHHGEDSRQPGGFPYRAVFHHLPQALLLCDASGSILDANQMAAEVFERPPVRLKDRLLGDILDLEGGGRVGEMLAATLEQRSVTLRCMTRSPFGMPRLLEVGAMSITAPGEHPPVVAVIVHDITTRDQALAHLKDLARSMDLLPVACCIADDTGRLTYGNPACCRLLNLPEPVESDTLLWSSRLALAGQVADAASLPALCGDKEQWDGPMRLTNGDGVSASGLLFRVAVRRLEPQTTGRKWLVLIQPWETPAP